ncbi:hypothetical protein RND81_11G005000 [Saponaria officinalis]|uniref:SBP-type domain-containing protein n=1 Tax=Saponaria officinalis TaxID=3572 RepID=A0AAW1HGP4_SAPOF
MSAISMMELNAKSPLMWDLENLVMFNAKDGETPKTLQLVESEIEGIEGFEVGSFYSSGGGSDLGYASSSRSSKSASDYSSTEREIKETKFSLETNDLRRKPTRTSPTIESSAASGESLTALELCNRTYFEDVGKATDVKNRFVQTTVPSESSVKKSKSSSLNLEIPRCQVEGCNVDLSSAKDYHRKHRVCETHSKCPRVVINGHERRFCQQCSRFHSLSEFDQRKRSCRRRLSDHNARRRKPKPEVFQFNSMRLASSLYEGRNQLNFGQVPVMHNRQGMWGSGSVPILPKLTPSKSGHITSVQGGGGTNYNGLQTTHDGLQNYFLSPKGTPPEVCHQGIAASVAESSNMEVAAQNQGALSLLSTTTTNTGCSTLDHQTMHHSNSPSLQQMHSAPPPVSSDFWISEQQQPGSVPESNTWSFQLFKAPNESGFYLY